MFCGTRVLLTRAFSFAYRAVTVSGRPFHAVLLDKTLITRRRCCCTFREVPQLQLSNASKLALSRFRLFPVRSPLLGESRLISFPPATEMFQFTGLSTRRSAGKNLLGCPIRRSADQSLLATPRSFSQLSTSFFVCRCLGILHALLVA